MGKKTLYRARSSDSDETTNGICLHLGYKRSGLGGTSNDEEICPRVLRKSCRG